MQPTRKEIAAALLERLGRAGEIKTLGRRLKGSVASLPTEQPALLLSMPDETYTQQGRGMPAIRRMSFTVWLYAKGASSDESAADAIADLLDGVDRVLAPNWRDGAEGEESVCTLGGLVERCEIVGQVETEENQTGTSQGYARFNIVILIP